MAGEDLRDPSSASTVRVVSLAIVARNEEDSLPVLLEDVLAQGFPRARTEVILVDSDSDDGTRDVMEAFAAAHGEEFFAVRVVDNPDRILAPGWNLAIETMTGDALLRVDAHSRIPSDFVGLNVETLNSGESVCGGRRPCKAAASDPWSMTLLAVENSLFGSSIGRPVSDDTPRYAKSLFHLAYRREVFEEVGGLNEKLRRTEDNEFNYRVRSAGFKLRFNPRIVSWQYVRSTFRGLLKQKYGNGLWIGLTTGVAPRCLSPYHFVPLLFVIAIVATLILAMQGIVLPAGVLWGLYLLFILIAMASSLKAGEFNVYGLLMPFLFLSMHLAYGIGSAVGLIRMPFMRGRLDDRARIRGVREKLVGRNGSHS